MGTRYTNTPNYNLRLSGTTVADKADTFRLWGLDLNFSLTAIDTQMKVNADAIATNASDITALENDTDLAVDTIIFNAWTDKGSGTSTGHTYDLDVSNLQKYNKTGGTATYLITLSNGGDGTYLIKLINGVGSDVTVTASGGTIIYPAGESNFTLATGNTGLYTIVKEGTNHYITQTEF